MNQEFDYLDSFIGTTFHQDVSIFGDTLEEIVASYKGDLSPEGIDLLQTQINAFLDKYKGQSDDDFATTFYEQLDWGLVKDAFGQPREFLTKVAKLLADPPQSSGAPANQE